jgi:hypothetical protein
MDEIQVALQTPITNFKNPFEKKKVDRINIEISKPSLFKKGNCIRAQIWFENGDTTGLQNVYGNDLSTVVNEMNTFIQSLV